MPTVSKTIGRKRVLDARPDRIDYRDREYQPLLESLPDSWPEGNMTSYFKEFRDEGLVMDQGEEGSCTGFGLAAVINFLLWTTRKRFSKKDMVSQRMLYHLARVYDAWRGEDYEGSSCRGAMKGWYHHGVCSRKLWRYLDENDNWEKPQEGWLEDAASRPLGAYYRVNKDSIADIQSAIYEVGAVYASVEVHNKWEIYPERRPRSIPIISPARGDGLHAIALVGYTRDGFVVQNSWSDEWGYYGFAVLTYEDWAINGADAWVATLGAPMSVTKLTRTKGSKKLRGLPARAASASISVGAAKASTRSLDPIDSDQAYEHTLVLGNDGVVLRRLIDSEDAATAVDEVVNEKPAAWLARRNSPKLAIYAHGGLNSESASIQRIQVMAPYFERNDIYPLFLTWKTGPGETIWGMLEDRLNQFFSTDDFDPTRGFWDRFKSSAADVKDRSIELAAQRLLVKSAWVEMKENARNGTLRGHGLQLLADSLDALRGRVNNLEIHLIGHSAGAILLGHLMQQMGHRQLSASTLSLFAPACSVSFANAYYGDAIDMQVIAPNKITVDVMSDPRERDDNVKIYGKSLLYLVSRALEPVHKMPILGMEAAWKNIPKRPDIWHKDHRGAVREWRSGIGKRASVRIHENSTVSNGVEQFPIAHGSFDNDVKVIGATLRRIRGAALRPGTMNLKELDKR